MKLTLWTYEGPPHVGAMRIATAMRDVHYVLHAPQGDTYADLLFTMIERRSKRPPVTYTTFQARDLGKDTAALFQSAVRDVIARYAPKALLVGASCTAELIQDDPAGLSAALHLSIPVVPLELPSYQKKENWGAAETFYQIVRQLLAGVGRPDQDRPGNGPSCNLLGPTGLGFRHRDDLTEIRGLIESLGISINVVAPWEADPDDIRRLPQADFNVVLYPETAHSVAAFLKRTYGQPHTTTIPIGIKGTEAFVRELAGLAGVVDQSDAWVSQAGAAKRGRAQWYCGSVDSTYLTGKRVFVFGDATHAIAAAAFAAKEVGFEVVGLGSYSREFAKELRTAAASYGLEATLTDDYLEVEATITKLAPDLVLGTQMERHIAKRLGIPCAVISAPVHVQDFPARYSPQMGYEGANVLFDTWVYPLMMGLEEHLLGMFKDDFEFHESATASHLGGAARSLPQPATPSASDQPITLMWEPEAERELGKIPFFVRSKARRNTEAFASEQGIARITKDTLYEAKAHYAR